jgi:DNA modification methylase
MNHTLINGDCLSLIPKLAPVKCVFADPPDNIGLGYDEYKDRKKTGDYLAWLEHVVCECAFSASICWWSFNAKWTFAMGRIFDDFLTRNQEWTGKPCVQVFTFGQNNKHDLGNNHRPLWRIMRRDAKLYPDAIKVPSWRQRNGDKRAAPGGRVPGDVFDMQYPVPGNLSASCRANLLDALSDAGMLDVWPGDVLDFPRVTGNSKQRCDWHPTQLHEELVERCIKLSTVEGDTVLDPFGGTGTTLRVCERLNRSCTLIELDKGYCTQIQKAHPKLKFVA